MKPPSTIRIDGETAYVKLTQNLEAAIDLADIHIVQDRRWRAQRSKSGNFYAITGQHPNVALMHRMIFDPPETDKVDHKDNYGLNNRRGNLRLATHSQNNANSIASSRNKLGMKGVQQNFVTKKYRAFIQLNGRKTHLGSFNTAIEASAAYLEAAKAAWGEFARN